MKLKLGNPKDFIRQLKRDQELFTIISTTFTKTIITESNEYYYNANSGLKMGELALIKAVKDYVIKNNIKTKCNRSKIQYIDKSTIKNGTYKKNLYEIDLKSAYWNFAYKNKFISKEIFERGNNKRNISKKARLISLGNLAKRRAFIEFDGFEFSKVIFESSDNTENIFFKVSRQVDMIMNQLKVIADKNYLFYWVDAIFVNSEKAKNEIEEFLKAENIEFKTILINKILKTQGYIKVWDELHDKPRPFIFEPMKLKDLSNVVY